MENLPTSKIERGTFLVATPDFDKGIFFRGVVLLCEHSETGSFGLVINKKLDVQLPEEIVNMQEIANQHVGIRAGGPVHTNQMMLLHTSSNLPQQTMETCEGVFLGGDLSFLQESVSDTNGPSIYLCFGYSAWSAGQLEREFLDGRWLLFPGSKKHVFETLPEHLWQQLLREMGGKYASLSTIPEDLSVN